MFIHCCHFSKVIEQAVRLSGAESQLPTRKTEKTNQTRPPAAEGGPAPWSSALHVHFLFCFLH
jgi:hypothetical protein